MIAKKKTEWRASFIRHVMLLFALTFFVSGVGCAAYPPTPEYAYDAKTYHLEKENAYQLSFLVATPYPADKALSFYTAHYLNKGWTKCYSKPGWEEYQDATRSAINLKDVRQKVSYFVNKGSYRIGVVSLRYVKHEGVAWADVPQNVVVIEYVLDKEGFEKSLSLLPIRCS